MSTLRSPFFVVILLTYLLAGGLYAILTPAWQAPDEPAHYNYIRYLANQPGFPELTGSCYDQAYLEVLKSHRFPPELPVESVCYEFHQPPLYYLLSLPVYVLSSGSLISLRLFSVALGAGVVILAFTIGRAVFPERPPLAYGTMAFVAFVPMHVAMLASVNNDALAGLIVATLLLLMIRRLNHEPPPTANRQSTYVAGQPAAQNDWLLGLLLGLGLITKLTVYIVIPLVAVMLWLAEGEAKRRSGEAAKPDGRFGTWPTIFRRLVVIYGLALLVALPWYARNAALYGNFDILGLGRHDEIVVGQLRTTEVIATTGLLPHLANLATTTFHSFWGQFGWMAVPMDQRTYQLLTILSLLALGGLIFTIYDLRFTHHSSLILLILTLLLTLLAYAWYNLTFVQFQGRYLFPALIPLGLFFTMGLYEGFTWRRRWWPVLALAGGLAWIVITSTRNTGLDKWGVLILGLALATAAGRIAAIRYGVISPAWFVAVSYGGLALLTLAAPFWFVIPHLSR